MQLIPAIDLYQGKAVRLYQGDFQQTTEYADDPVNIAQAYQSAGASRLHVVDLKAAQSGQSQHLKQVLAIKDETQLQIQLGGGIRDEKTVDEWLCRGIARLVIGSVAVNQPQKVRQWLKCYGAEKIVLALDVKVAADNVPYVATHGWQTQSQKSLWEVLDDYAAVGLQHLLCTDIARDGTLQGSNIALYQAIQKRFPAVKLQASGGVGSLQDLAELKATQVDGVIIGKALYEKQFSLSEAMQYVS